MATPGELAQDLANMASDFRNSMDSFAGMAGSSGGLEQATINIGLGGVDANISVGPAPNGFGELSWNASKPSDPGLTVPSPDNIPTAPTYSLIAPTLVYPQRPDSSLPAAPGESPTFQMPLMPSAPDLRLPLIPTLEAIYVPPTPSVHIPTFDSTLVEFDITEPNLEFDYVEKPFADAMMDSLKVKLMNDLLNGGYGIETQDELGLWMRAADREAVLSEQVMQDVARQAAARGLALPPGALFAQLEAARLAAAARSSTLSRDIAIKRADLYVENRKFTIEQVRQTEQMLLAHHAGIMERSIQAAKAVVELGVLAYNAKVERLKFYLERYKVQGQVYEVTLRAALANLEAFKAQMDSVKVSVDVQRARVELYDTQLKGVQTVASIYQTQMQAANIEAQIQGLKLEGFKTSVQTFSAVVQAKVGAFDMYKAAIGGETARIDAFKGSVQAFSSEVEAYKARVEGIKIKYETTIRPLELKAELYKTALTAYGAEVNANAAKASAEADRARVAVAAYSANTSASTAAASVAVAAYHAQAQANVAAAGIVGNIAVQNASMVNARATAAAQLSGNLAAMYGTAMASALGAVGTLDANIISTAG
jgi:hypothetical protein